MTIATEHNLGEQPIARIMLQHGPRAHDLVAISTEHITHKMVSRACKGRRLTPNVQSKIRNALATAMGREYAIEELFTYGSTPSHREECRHEITAEPGLEAGGPVHPHR